MFIKQTYLYCDGNSENCRCGNDEAYGAEQDRSTIREYKESIKGMGWVFRPNNKAYCPECAADMKRERE